MRFFYIQHHFLAILRSKSLGGELFALAMLGFFFLVSGSLAMKDMDSYVSELNAFFGRNQSDYSLFLMSYLFIDLSVRLVFRRPLSQMKYYILWSPRTAAIAGQYLFTSLFGIMPFVLLVSFVMIFSKTGEWLGFSAAVSIALVWLGNHYLALSAQFAPKGFRQGLFIAMVCLLLVSYWAPTFSIEWLYVEWFFGLSQLVVFTVLAYLLVKRALVARKAYDVAEQEGLLDRLPVVHFKNPIFQLEWALLVRNKRTRSNLLMGLISVLILPFVMTGETSAMLTTLIYIITTGFFIIQHGVYSLGWEGSYYDFLVSNVKPLAFVRTRYAFYALTCLVGLVLGTVSVVVLGMSWLNLFSMFLYNIGVTIPLVLYRSTLNDTRIVLTENSFMNYNGMMTAPIFVSSFLVILLPLILLGVAQVLLGNQALLLLGAFGVISLGFYKPITRSLASRYQKRKYHLSQSFKA